MKSLKDEQKELSVLFYEKGLEIGNYVKKWAYNRDLPIDEDAIDSEVGLAVVEAASRYDSMRSVWEKFAEFVVWERLKRSMVRGKLLSVTALPTRKDDASLCSSSHTFPFDTDTVDMLHYLGVSEEDVVETLTLLLDLDNTDEWSAVDRAKRAKRKHNVRTLLKSRYDDKLCNE